MTNFSEKSALSGLSDLKKNKVDDKENLWTKILGEVQSGDRDKLSSSKSILVLGDNESGKTTLVAKLQGNEDPKKGSGLEYAYINVRDEYRDDHTRLSVWILDGDPKHSELLEFAINEKNLHDTLVILTVSMTKPWLIMDQLHTWACVLQDHIDKLKIDHDFFLERQNAMVKLWQDYIEPGDELDASGAVKRSSRNLDEDPLLPLPENVLTRNLGLNVVVVVTKTDHMSTLEKENYKEDHFDFIQQSIRKFCLHYGAALFYTSVKEDKNCDVLYKYLVHRIYSFPFKTPALVVEKDAVFIPSGWDNLKKISILYENMQSMTPEDYYTDVIPKPHIVRKSVMKEMEVQAEEENDFLARHLAQLQNTAALAMHNRTESPLRQSPAVQKTADRRVSAGAAPGQMGSPKKIDATKAGNISANEGVLANFFNALLNKRTVRSPPPVPVPNFDKSIMRSDAAAELDRLSRGKKMSAPPAMGSGISGEPTLNLSNSALSPTGTSPASSSPTPPPAENSHNSFNSSEC